jgi:hypothetical protein
MQTIEIKTLIDVTETKVVRLNQGTPIEHDQHRNFVTLKQCIEIRSNITYDFIPTKEVIDVKDMGFGSQYKGKHAVWTFRFRPDLSGVYSDGKNEIGCLFDDVHGVPVIEKLTETINIDKAIFDLTNNLSKNTIIKTLAGNI